MLYFGCNEIRKKKKELIMQYLFIIIIIFFKPNKWFSSAKNISYNYQIPSNHPQFLQYVIN